MEINRVVMTGPGAVELLRDTLDDELLKPYDVVLRTLYSAISPGTELAHYTGTADLSRHIPAQPYPWSPGYAAVGEVLAAGAEAGVVPGELLLAHTPHQSAVRFDSQRCLCRPVPAGVPPRDATLARLGQVGAVGLRTSAAHVGDWAAVVGLGIVGACAAQLLRAAGMHVVGVETMPARRALANCYGLTMTVDPRQEGAIEAAIARTAGCRLVLECSGQPRGVQTALALAAPHAEIVLVGAAWRRETEVLATDILRPVFDNYLTLRSGWEWQLPLYGDGPVGSIASCTDWVLSCIQDGSLRTDVLITDTIAPSAAPRAYRRLLDDPEAHLAMVIDWTGDTA